MGLRELSALTPEHRAEITDHRRYYQRRVRDVIAAGVRSGEFAVDRPGRAAVAILDMVNGISNWFRARRRAGARRGRRQLRRPDRRPDAGRVVKWK